MTIQRLAGVIRLHLRPVLAMLLLGVACASFYLLTARPAYTASTTMYVSTTGSGSINDLSVGSIYAQQAVKSYADIATTPVVLDRVESALDGAVSAAALARATAVSVPVGTVLIDVDVTLPSPALAAQSANTIAEVLPIVVGDLNTEVRNENAVQISVVRPAVAPVGPSSPNTLLALALGALSGLAAGALYVFFRQTFDTVLRRREDVARFISEPLIGLVPFDRDAPTHPVAGEENSSGSRAESYRQLRTSLKYVRVDYPSGIALVVTSSVPSEGKSTTALNLASALAADATSVVLVEADLRRPSVASYLGLDHSVGLSDVLIGQVELDDAIQTWGSHGMKVLPGGSTPPNAGELLGSRRMHELLRELLLTYEVVLLDAPPVLPVADATVLGQMVDGVVMVVGLGQVRGPELTLARDRLAASNNRIICTVASTMRGRLSPESRRTDAYYYGYGSPSAGSETVV